MNVSAEELWIAILLLFATYFTFLVAYLLPNYHKLLIIKLNYLLYLKVNKPFAEENNSALLIAPYLMNNLILRPFYTICAQIFPVLRL